MMNHPTKRKVLRKKRSFLMAYKAVYRAGCLQESSEEEEELPDGVQSGVQS